MRPRSDAPCAQWLRPVISDPQTVSSQHTPVPGTKKSPTVAVCRALLAILVLLILPGFGAAAMMIGSAVCLLVYVFLVRDEVRTRGGSLVLAIVLVSAFAAAAAVWGLRLVL